MRCSTSRSSDRVSLSRAADKWFESLESRVLLCATPNGVPPTNDPVQLAILEAHDHHGDEWHVSRADLTAQELKVLNPHFVLDERPESQPANFVNPIGSVLYDPNVRVPSLALPDMFPSLSGSPSIDQTSQTGRTLLRFGTQVNNMGAGPATLVSSGSDVNADGTQNVYQRLYNYDPTTNSFSFNSDRPAGRFVWHPGHSHFHYEGYASYQLMTRNTDGTVGPVAIRTDGTQVVGAKIGFCLINIASSFILPNGQSSTTLPGYNGSGQPSTGCGFLQGISVGMADVYSSGLEGQWIDVTGVPNGQYFIQISLDSRNALMESNEANNAQNFPVTINVNPTSGGIQPDLLEPNNSLAKATDLAVLGVSNNTGLTIHTGPDQDWFKFAAASSGTGSVGLTIASGDVNLYLYDADGNFIAQSTNPSGSENINYNFVKDQIYYARAISYNSTLSSNYAFTTNIKPTVTHSVQFAKMLSQSTTPNNLTIARNGPTTTGLTVNLSVGGTAVPGVDYQALPGSVAIGANSSSSVLQIVPLPATSTVTDVSTITITISPASGYAVGTSTITVLLIHAFSTPGGASAGGSILPSFNDPIAGLSRQPLPGLFDQRGSLVGGSDDSQMIDQLAM